jgi:hypothetical protein
LPRQGRWWACFALKKAQSMLWHATMAMTADTYGHLLPDLENDAAKLAVAARALVQTTSRQ